MLHCLRPSTTTPTSNLQPLSPSFPASSADGTPRQSTQPSPTVNLSREYTLAVQTSSYSEIWSKIHIESGQVESDGEPGTGVLQPNRECVEEALRHARPNTLTRLVSDYFNQSERTSQLCLLLHDSVRRAHSIYFPIHELLDVLPQDFDSNPNRLTESQCDRAVTIFLQFDRLENPFPCSDSHNFHDMRRCFSELKDQLDRRLDRSRSRVRLLRHACAGSAVCLVGTVVIVAISAVAVATHGFVALAVGGSFLLAFLPPSKMAKKEVSHLAQLDAAAKGTYVLHNDLDTIDRLVVRLHEAVESDKILVRLGLERGGDRHPIREVVKQLHKNYRNFLGQLTDLEEHICLCFAAINRARSDLLQEIHLHQTANI